MRLFDRAVLVGGTSLSVLIVPTIAEAWRTASLGAEWLIHADGPPEGHTGGFGEPTCQDCHSENELNASGGVLGVEGVPAAYQPGTRYRITVVLHSDDCRSAHDALAEIRSHLLAGYCAIYDADLKAYFDSIPHKQLLACLRLRISDRQVLKLIRLWLQVPVVEPSPPQGGGGGRLTPRSTQGTPQGGVISPLLANVYLHWLDVVFHRRRGPAHWAEARLVRYADDFVVMARSIEGRLTGWIEETLEGWLALTLNREKTRVLDLRQPGSSLDFLGYTFRFDRDRYGRGSRYLNMVPSKRALARTRATLRQLTDKRMCFKPIPELVIEINTYLQSWAVYFGQGYPRQAFREINAFTRQRLHRHLRRRSQRPWRPPQGTTVYAQLARMGLCSL